ncbi:MAG: DUF1016 family protein [Spirochaetales bacterium]|nr:DUF1016 family protein [Spirochaetales bacterium]
MQQEYTNAVKAIKNAILTSQYEAAKDVNRVQLVLYFGIGRFLSSKKGKETWGGAVLDTISTQLRKELPGLRGFSATSLKNMRLFYENWSFLEDCNSSVIIDGLIDEHLNSSDASDEFEESQNLEIVIPELKLSGININDFPIENFFKVPFSHHIAIFSKVKNLQERYYYIQRVVEDHLSVDALESLIKTNAYNHQKEIPNNFKNTIASSRLARKAIEMFKDEYLLNFINVEEIGERDKADIDERVVEQEIIHNVKNFIMTFGHDFAFVGNQYHLEMYGHDQYPDLLFYNRELAALVAVELKYGEFKPAYLGQLSAYLRILDDKVKKPFENPSIGIILCKQADKNFVEYLIQGYNNPMGVATYKTAEDVRRVLPSEEELANAMKGM